MIHNQEPAQSGGGRCVSGQEILAVAGIRPALYRPGAAFDGHHVDQAPAGDGVVHHMAAPAEPEARLVPGKGIRSLGAVEGGPPGDVAAKRRRRAIAEPAPDLGPDAVGADDGVEGSGLAGAPGGHEGKGGMPRILTGELGQSARDEADLGHRSDGVEEDRLQVGPVDNPVGGAEMLAHEGPERDLPDLPPRRNVAHDHATGFGDDAAQGRAEAETGQDAACVGGELETRSDLAEPGAAFDEGDRMSLPGERESRRQAADSGADDRDGQSLHLSARRGRWRSPAPRRIGPGAPRPPSGTDRT